MEELADHKTFRQIVDNMMDLVALHEPDGTYIYVSHSVENILGYKPEELVGKSPYEFFHKDDISHIQNESHRQAKLGQEVITAEYRFRKKNGKYVWFDTKTMPLKDENNEVVRLQTVSRDVTQKKKDREQLRELNEELSAINEQKDRLLSVISHDLRGPFHSFLGLFDIVLKDYDACSREELYELLKQLKKSSDSTFDLMQDLLLWSKNQFNARELNIEKVNMKASAQKVINYLEGQATQKSLGIKNNIDPELSVATDKHMYKTIMRNLLSNAIKFSRNQSEIKINSRKNGRYVYMTVVDNGVGIEPNKVDKIMSINNLHSTDGTGGEKGFGLGLSICKDFITKLGGELMLESELGKGSQFTFTLPKATN